MLKIVNNNMALAINANSVAKGIDPRNFTLMGFGGAGPLHAVSLAEAIFARDVISPVHPGITAATGLLVTDLQYEYTHSTLIVLDKASDDEFATRQRRARRSDRARQPRSSTPTACAGDQRRFRQIAECRYVGQGFELRADVPDGQLDAGERRGRHREFLQRPQAGLRPRLPRPVLRDGHAARGGDSRRSIR